jgi:hypothetical protein
MEPLRLSMKQEIWEAAREDEDRLDALLQHSITLFVNRIQMWKDRLWRGIVITASSDGYQEPEPLIHWLIVSTA